MAPAIDLSRFCEACPPPEEADNGRGIKIERQPGTWVHSYRPHSEAQRAFHESNAKYRWARGGLGSGKSRAICEEIRLHACHRLQGIPHVGLVASQTYRHLIDNTLPVLRAAFPPPLLAGGAWDVAFRKSEMMLLLANGSAIALRTAHNGRYESWRGPEYAYLVLDESRNFPDRKAWEVGIGRLRYPGVPPQHLRAWVGSTTNGFDWNHAEWHGKHRTEKHEDFLLLTKDNPHLPDGYFEDLLASLDEEDAEQELFGKFIARQGQCYRNLSADPWPGGNVVRLDPDPGCETDLEIDWGYRSPRAHLVQTHELLDLGSGERVGVDVIVGEWRLSSGKPPANKTVGDMLDWMTELHGAGWNLSRVFCDPAGDSANDQEHMTSVEQVYRHLEMLYHRRIPVVYPRKPWQRSKLTGERTVRARIRDAAGVRRLAWSCDAQGVIDARNSLEAIQGLRFPEDRDGQAQKDVSLKDGQNDHDGDAMRYRAVMLYGRDRTRAPAREAVRVR